MTIKKKLIISIIIFVISISFLFLFTHRNNQQNVPQRPLPKPEIQTSVQGEFETEISINFEGLQIPSTLPVYEITQNEIKSNILNKITLSLGFNTEPKIVEDPVLGPTYFYNDSGKSLRVLTKQNIFDYRSGVIPTSELSVIPVQSEMDSIAKNYLVENGFIDNLDDIDLLKMRTLRINPFEGIERSGPPTAIVLTYSKSINGYKVISETYETGTISITYNNELDVVSVYFDEVPEFMISSNRPLKSAEQITDNINTIAIVSLDDGKIDTTKVTDTSVRKITLNSIEIAYLQEISSEQRYLQPIYLFKGDAFMNNGENIQAEFYLPAIDYSQP